MGIDQHRKQLTVHVRDDQGEVVLRRQVSTQWDMVGAFLGSIKVSGPFFLKRFLTPVFSSFHEPRGQREERLARWAGTCRGRSYPARWAGLGERLAPWAARRLLPLRPRHNQPQRGPRGSPGIERSDHPRSTPATTPAPRRGCQNAWVNRTSADEPHRPAN